MNHNTAQTRCCNNKARHLNTTLTTMIEIVISWRPLANKMRQRTLANKAETPPLLHTPNHNVSASFSASPRSLDRLYKAINRRSLQRGWCLWAAMQQIIGQAEFCGFFSSSNDDDDPLLSRPMQSIASVSSIGNAMTANKGVEIQYYFQFNMLAMNQKSPGINFLTLLLSRKVKEISYRRT